MLGDVPHFNLPNLPLPQYPIWGANILNSCRVVVKPSKNSPITLTVLASDPTRADAGVGSRWMVFDSAAGGAVVFCPELLTEIRLEAIGIVMRGYGGNRSTNWSGVFPGYGRVWIDQDGPPNILALTNRVVIGET